MRIKSTGKLHGIFLFLNNTPMDGEIYFTTNRARVMKKGNDYLNEVYFKIWGLYFMSRIVWIDHKYIPERIDKIKDAHMTFGCIMVNNLGQTIYRNPDFHVSQLSKYSALPKFRTGVFNLAQEYIGDVRLAWFMVEKGYTADRKYPGVFFNPVTMEYYACNYDGIGAGFAIGDKVFDENWRPAADILVTNIPFNERGDKVINDLTYARIAANNLVKYLRK